MMKLVCRTSNRIFVGLPLCTLLSSSINRGARAHNVGTGRDPDYGKLNIEFTVDVVKSALLINLFPEFLRP